MSSSGVNAYSFSDFFRLVAQGLLRIKKKRSRRGNRRPRGQYKFFFRPPGGSKVLRFIQEVQIRISCSCYRPGLSANILCGLFSVAHPLYGNRPQPLLRAGSQAARGKIVIGGSPGVRTRY
jgi:hypothetical protein